MYISTATNEYAFLKQESPAQLGFIKTPSVSPNALSLQFQPKVSPIPHSDLGIKSCIIQRSSHLTSRRNGVNEIHLSKIQICILILLSTAWGPTFTTFMWSTQGLFSLFKNSWLCPLACGCVPDSSNSVKRASLRPCVAFSHPQLPVCLSNCPSPRSSLTDTDYPKTTNETLDPEQRINRVECHFHVILSHCTVQKPSWAWKALPVSQRCSNLKD